MKGNQDSTNNASLVKLIAVIIILGIIAIISLPTIANMLDRQEIRKAESTFYSIEEYIDVFARNANDGTYNLDQIGMNFGSNTISKTQNGSHDPENINFTVNDGIFYFNDNYIYINGYKIDTNTGLVDD